MSAPRPGPYITLGFHPTARGFGWVAFDGPFTLYDSGLFTPKGAKEKVNERCLHKLEALLERIRPEAFVLEAFDKHSSLRSERIRRLCLAVVNLVADRGLELAVYPRGDVQASFATVGARSRDEIAQAVVRHVEALRVRLPKKRGAGDSEDKRLSIFCAAALVLTHYHLGATRIFDDLREAA